MIDRTGAPVLVLGSASIHVARFVRGLCAAGRSVVLATHGELPLGPLPGLREQVVLDLSVTSWSAVSSIRALMRQWSPSVIHAHQVNSVAWHAVRAARGSGVPVVLTLWGSDVLTLPSRSPLHRWMVRSALQGAAAWTADARVLLDAATQIAGPCAGIRRELIPIGIDAPPPGSQTREHRLLSCRLHKPLYRIDAILRAFASLPASRADWVLEVAASGEQTPALAAPRCGAGRGRSRRVQRHARRRRPVARLPAQRRVRQRARDRRHLGEPARGDGRGLPAGAQRPAGQPRVGGDGPQRPAGG